MVIKISLDKHGKVVASEEAASRESKVAMLGEAYVALEHVAADIDYLLDEGEAQLTDINKRIISLCIDMNKEHQKLKKEILQ